jgi:hypothetical protein
MKVTNHSKAQGAILGKAMTGLSKGRAGIAPAGGDQWATPSRTSRT